LPGFGQHPVLAFWNDSWNVISDQRDGLFWYRKDGLDWPGRDIGDRGSADAQFAVDGSGVAHVVYVTSKGLVHVSRDGKLSDDPIDGTAGAHKPLLAVDSGGQPELVYTDPSGQVWTRRFDGELWAEAQHAGVDGADSFAIDASDNAHYLYVREGGTADIVYQSRQAGVANTVLVASVQPLPDGSTAPLEMAVDSLGRPHVVFVQSGDASGVYLSLGPAL
jgi:hypothetical protein